MYKVAFLSLDVQCHHVYHILPIAFELSCQPGCAVTVYYRPQHGKLIQDLLKLYPHHNCCFIEVNPPMWLQLKYTLKKKQPSLHKMMKFLMPQLIKHDAVVTSDYIQNECAATLKRNQVCKIFCKHGPAARNYGTDESLLNFDLLLVPGQKDIDRWKGFAVANQIEIIKTGYAKFDVTLNLPQVRVFSQKKTTILYAPHFMENLSSLHGWAQYLLEYFYNHPQYNFIFAPHVNTRRSLLKKFIKKKYLQADNIHIDLGSSQAADMTYTRLADCYIGDVSSQVTEFLHKPRPCLFLNAHNIDWQSDPYYHFWQAGQVVNDLDGFAPALQSMLKNNPYKHIQQEKFTELFSPSEVPSGLRAAKAIAEFMQDQLSEYSIIENVMHVEV